MKDKLGQGKPDDSHAVRQKTQKALKRLAADAERLKMISELQSLQGNPIRVSLDTQELLEVTRLCQANSTDFATLDELLNLLNLMASKSDELVS